MRFNLFYWTINFEKIGFIFFNISCISVKFYVTFCQPSFLIYFWQLVESIFTFFQFSSFVGNSFKNCQWFKKVFFFIWNPSIIILERLINFSQIKYTLKRWRFNFDSEINPLKSLLELKWVVFYKNTSEAAYLRDETSLSFFKSFN